MAKNITVVINQADDLPVWWAGNLNFGVSRLINYLSRLVGGCAANSSISVRADAVAATGTLTLSTASGTVGGIINGTTVTVTASGGDTATAAALVTAINSAASIVKDHVLATSSAGVVTLTAKIPGLAGNAITLAASGTGVTASGTRLTGGSETAVDSFSV